MKLNEYDLIASLSRESFYTFLQEFWGEIIHEPPTLNWHIEYICNELQEVAERVFRKEEKRHDLVINVPPGSTKSTIISQMFPAWVWTRMPEAQFICASYAYMIAQKDSIRTRDIVQSDLYQNCFPGIQLREDENTKGLFQNTQRGFRLAVGIGGAVTGYHGHFLIVDDPLNPEEALSEAELKATNSWMESTLPSRKLRFQNDVVPLILVQQRLHQADPSGELLDPAKENKVKHICLPGEVTEKISPPELREKYVDGLMDPYRFPRPILKKLEKELGAYGYAGQILQDPVPLGGGMFQTDKLIIEQHMPKRFVRKVRSWDKAGTEKGGNYSAGCLMGVDENESYWVLDVVRGQWGSFRREALIRQTAEIDGEEVEVIVEMEGGSGGKESGENTVRGLAGFRVSAFHPTGDKVARAYAFSSQVGGGNVYVLNRDWTRDFISELRFFPKGKYDDQVDAASGAFNRLAKPLVRVGGFGRQ